METRPATVDDVEFLTDVVVATSRDQGRLPDDFDEVEFRRRYGDWTRQQLADPEPGGTTCVVMVNGERIGRLRVVRSGGVIELAGIQLAPRFQNRGIGTAVIDGLEHEAAASGSSLELGVGKDNPRARALYERLGFVRIGQTDDEVRMRWNGRPQTGTPR